jgi:hypothetical protein
MSRPSYYPAPESVDSDPPATGCVTIRFCACIFDKSKTLGDRGVYEYIRSSRILGESTPLIILELVPKIMRNTARNWIVTQPAKRGLGSKDNSPLAGESKSLILERGLS